MGAVLDILEEVQAEADRRQPELAERLQQQLALLIAISRDFWAHSHAEQVKYLILAEFIVNDSGYWKHPATIAKVMCLPVELVDEVAREWVAWEDLTYNSLTGCYGVVQWHRQHISFDNAT
jgi:hypothetical protein